MSNILESLSLALKLKVGIVPSTKAYEEKYRKSWENVDFYCNYSKGGELEELKKLKASSPVSKEDRSKRKARIAEIEHSENYKRFEKLSKSSKNKTLLTYEQTFVEDFEGNDLNPKLWLNKFFWGDKLLGQGYSQASEYHHYTEGENVAVKDGSLIITTKEQPNVALSWDKTFGFMPRKCKYTSGIVNTGNSFRQQNGRFEAKVTFEKTDGVYNAFWMVGETSTPHLNVFKVNNQLQMGIINGIKKDDEVTVSSDLLKENSYIVGIEWNKKQIKWLINGVVVKKSSNNLPNEPLYLVFSSGVHKDISEKVSNKFKVEWIKCFKIN